MAISINVSNDNAANNINHNSSGGITSPLGKRGPLSDLNSPRIKKETAVPTAAKSRSASSSFSLSSSTKHNKYIPGHNDNGRHGRPPSKDKIEIEATNESHASVSQLSHWLSVEQKKKSQQQQQQQPIHHHTLPIRFQTKPRIKKSEVEATDEKRVSVKTLSTWMNDDPFEQRKVRTIRSGSKVITTSRIFEKDVSATASKECNITEGSVGERQAWLCGAFKSNDEEEEHQKHIMREQVLVDKQRKVWTNPNAVKKHESSSSSPREEELKSVKDKKEWLSKAFNKGGGENESGDSRGGGGEGASVIIHQTKSFETKSHASGGGGGSYSTCGSMSNNIHQTKSFEHHHTTTIQQTKSYEGRTSSNSDALEREPSVVRLYNQNDKTKQTEGDESSKRTLKTVHDKQAWLTSAFKKPTAVGSSGIGGNPHAVPSPAVVKKEVAFTATAAQQQPSVEKEKTPPVVNKDDSSAANDDKPNMDNMTVAERARWLRGAFK